MPQLRTSTIARGPRPLIPSCSGAARKADAEQHHGMHLTPIMALIALKQYIDHAES
jgi:hypothetical protein